MPSDASTPEQPTRRSVGDASSGDSTTATRPLTRRELRERAARRAAEQSASAETGSVAEARAAVPTDAAERPAADARPEPAAESRTPGASDAAPESASTGDAFAAAAKALNFSGDSATATDGGVDADEERPVRDAVRRGARKRRVMTTATASLSAIAAVGLLAVGITTPLGALLGGADQSAMSMAQAASVDAGGADDEEIQAFVAADDATPESLDRISDYETATFSDMAESAGIDTSGAFFVNDPTADIQWPFAVGTGMSYGYGMRSGRMHEGIDFTPGNGAPVQAIADGTVRVATESGGAYGVNVYIDHVIDGEVITSHYAHMQYGSLRVTAGQKVEVGDVVGLVGDTGRSFGAHAHVELLKGGATFDPMPWFEKYAGTHYSDDESDDGNVDFASEDAK